MELQILQENLEKAVNIASRFASAKAQLPILGNILISAGKSKITISSTNLELSVSLQVGAKISKEGKISVPAKVLYEILSNLPKETITMEAEKEQLKLSTGGFSSNILGMDPTDFPNIPNSINNKNKIGFAKKDFLESLGKVVFSTSSDETRPVLTGVLFIIENNTLILVSTDGFRLSKKTILLSDYKGENKKVVIPKNVLNEIGRGIITSDNFCFDLQESEKQIVFGFDEIVITSRLLEGEYPDFERIIPKESKISVLLDKEEFLRSIKLASIFAREAANVVHIKILDSSIKVFAESGQAGSQETKVDAKVEKDSKEDFEIAFNYHYLEDFVHSVTGEEIKMDFINSSAAGVFRDTSDKNYLHLIMPIKI